MTHEPIIHIVDDDEAVLKILAHVVGEVYPRVKTYASAREFLASLQVGETGCLLLDVYMPDMDGFELYKKLKARGIFLSVIFMTCHGDIKMAVQAIKDGAHDFIEKPFDNRHLLARIRSGLAVVRYSEEIGIDPNEIKARLQTLTPREREVLELVVGGETNKGVARELGISEKTVEIHRANMITKMKAKTLAALVKMSLIAKTGITIEHR